MAKQPQTTLGKNAADLEKTLTSSPVADSSDPLDALLAAITKLAADAKSVRDGLIPYTHPPQHNHVHADPHHHARLHRRKAILDDFVHALAALE